MKDNAKSAHHMNYCASLADVDMKDPSHTHQFTIKNWSVGYKNGLVLSSCLRSKPTWAFNIDPVYFSDDVCM